MMLDYRPLCACSPRSHSKIQVRVVGHFLFFKIFNNIDQYYQCFHWFSLVFIGFGLLCVRLIPLCPVDSIAGLTYCPWLPFVACVMMHFMSEEHVFACCAAMIANHAFLFTTRADTWNMLEAFKDLVQDLAPKCHTSLSSPMLAEMCS